MKNKALNTVIACALFSVSSLVNVANAAIISNYSKIVVDDNWTVVYQGGYGTRFDYASILGNIAPGSTVALASSSSAGSSNYDLFASTTTSILNTFTASNTTVFDNDTFWYRNSRSLGFADTSQITQNSADTVCRFDVNCGDLRLSWHTNDGAGNVVNGGWRSGINTNLNNNNTWQRYVLVQEAVAASTPGTVAIFALGVMGLAARRFKK